MKDRSVFDLSRLLGAGVGLCLALTLTACPAPTEEKQAEGTASAASEEKKPQAQKMTIEVPEGTGPVATVNGVEIARETFNKEYVQTLERYQRARHEVKPALKERLKDNIVRRLVDAELIRQQAKKMEISVPTAEMEEKWQAHKKRYGSEEAFTAFLARAGTTAEDVRSQFENNMLRDRVFAAVSDKVSLEPKAAKEFYDKNKKRYAEPEQVRARHILIRVSPKATPEEKAGKKKQAEDILKKAKKRGAKFETLAKEHGEDPTKDRGGDLGYFAKGRMVKPFEEAVWELKKGQISPKLVETQFGFHVVRKEDHKKARQKPFKEVREQIERSLKARKRNQAIRDALNGWKEEAKIEIFVKGDPKIIAAGRASRVTNPRITDVKKPLKLDSKTSPVKLRKMMKKEGSSN